MDQNSVNEEQNPSNQASRSVKTPEVNAAQKYQNPLPCGCGIMGTPQLNGYGAEYELRQEYVNRFIKFCPLHAAAPALYEMLKLSTRESGGEIHARSCGINVDMFCGTPQFCGRVRAALALADGSSYQLRFGYNLARLARGVLPLVKEKDLVYEKHSK